MDDVFLKSTQRIVCLGSRFASGGEAHLYKHPEDSSRVLKIFRRTTRKRAKKLKVMIANPITAPSAKGGAVHILWPIDLITDAARPSRVLGYEMPFAPNCTSLVRICNPSTRGPAVDWSFRLNVARNVAWGVATLHDQGVVIGDLRPSNILVGPQGETYFVDCDSFQIRSGSQLFPCLVGRPEFTPAELHGQPFDKVTREPSHDNFALAVILYMLLTDGSHPFSAWYRGGGQRMPLHLRIQNGCWPHAINRTHDYHPKRQSLPVFRSLAPQLQRLMHRCFDKGHLDPAERPSAQDWHVAIDVILSTKRFPAKRMPLGMSGRPLPRRTRRSVTSRLMPNFFAGVHQRAALIAALLVVFVLCFAIVCWRYDGNSPSSRHLTNSRKNTAHFNRPRRPSAARRRLLRLQAKARDLRPDPVPKKEAPATRAEPPASLANPPSPERPALIFTPVWNVPGRIPSISTEHDVKLAIGQRLTLFDASGKVIGAAVIIRCTGHSQYNVGCPRGYFARCGWYVGIPRDAFTEDIGSATHT